MKQPLGDHLSDSLVGHQLLLVPQNHLGKFPNWKPNYLGIGDRVSRVTPACD